MSITFKDIMSNKRATETPCNQYAVKIKYIYLNVPERGKKNTYIYIFFSLIDLTIICSQTKKNVCLFCKPTWNLRLILKCARYKTFQNQSRMLMISCRYWKYSIINRTTFIQIDRNLKFISANHSSAKSNLIQG